VSDIQRRELGQFLRSRRERITPEQAGLATFGRRRTPGLRREEVASLAGVGVTWYTWLEQGRDINASDQVLEAIARALVLDPDERRHLFTLAGAPSTVPTTDCPEVGPAVRAVLDKLDPYPACVQTARFDILAYNNAYRHLTVDLQTIPQADHNCVVLAFLYPEWSEKFADFDAVATRMVGRLRSAMAPNLDNPPWTTMIDRLIDGSPLFRDLWNRLEVKQSQGYQKVVDNPMVGRLTMHFTSFWMSQSIRLSAMSPVDDLTHTRLLRLAELTAAPAAAISPTSPTGALQPA
jgi:transcriptional regulator with XRE-family HTH domain